MKNRSFAELDVSPLHVTSSSILLYRNQLIIRFNCYEINVCVTYCYEINVCVTKENIIKLTGNTSGCSSLNLSHSSTV